MGKIYLDYASSMPVDPRVFEYAKRFLLSDMGNPSSLHTAGIEAKRAIEDARKKVAELINAEEPETIIFTSGATEANNLAIKGVALRNVRKGKVVAASAIDHISVLNAMKELSKRDFIFNTIPVDPTGILELDKMNDILTKGTTVTSIMYANSEIGTIEPIRAISELVHDKANYFHVDATNAAGKIPIDVQKDGIDLLTISGNDLSGPQGVGALYVKPGVKPQPIIQGGGQERGMRSGTENLFGIGAMGEAALLTKLEMNYESQRLQAIRDELISRILEIEETYLTGHPTQRLPNHASFRFSHIEGESIQLSMNMYNIQIATGSACTSKTLEPSHVLLGIGLKHEEAHGSMVMTLGRSNKIEEVPTIVNAVKNTVKRLRELSPLR